MNKKTSNKKFLNVGGNSKDIPVPTCFEGWEHLLLDIDPVGKPDIVCDAREIGKLVPKQFHSVYCSHNLEHFYHHEVPKVLQGFRHVLKPTGFVMISVPDLEDVIRSMTERGLDLDDVLYYTEAGIPILVRDVFYGWGFRMGMDSHDYFAHKTGFTEKTLVTILKQNGFKYVFMQRTAYNLVAVGFMRKPQKWALDLLGLPT